MANQTRVCVLAVLVLEGAKTRLSGQNKNLAFLTEGLLGSISAAHSSSGILPEKKRLDA